MLKKYDKFYATIIKQGTSLYVLVPANLIKYSGLGESVEVECYIRRKPEEV